MKRKNNLRKSINESVKQFIMEFGSGNSEKAKENRKKMAMASKRAIDKGDDSVYHNSVRSITTGGGSKNDLADFNDDFEKLNSQPANNLATEGRNQIKVSESQLKEIIRESVERILNETFKSQKLAAMARQHGGIRGGNKHGRMDIYADSWVDGEPLQLTDVTDDMIGDEAMSEEDFLKAGFSRDNRIEFKDGTYVPVTNIKAARQVQKDWDANNPYRYNYEHTSGFSKEPNNRYQKYPSRFTATTKKWDLESANRVRNNDNAERSLKRDWATWEKYMRPAINQAYQNGGWRNLNKYTNDAYQQYKKYR